MQKTLGLPSLPGARLESNPRIAGWGLAPSHLSVRHVPLPTRRTQLRREPDRIRLHHDSDNSTLGPETRKLLECAVEKMGITTTPASYVKPNHVTGTLSPGADGALSNRLRDSTLLTPTYTNVKITYVTLVLTLIPCA